MELIELRQEFPESARLVDSIANDLPDGIWTIAQIARLLGLGKKTVGYHVLHNMPHSYLLHGATGDYWVATTADIQKWAVELLPGILRRKRERELRQQESRKWNAEHPPKAWSRN